MGPSKLDRAFKRFRKTGDAGALATVFDSAADELMQVARYLCTDEAEAEDAVQATFQTAIEKAAGHDGKRATMPWLLGILALHARKARDAARRAPDPRRLADRLPTKDVADPADLASDAEMRTIVEREVDLLPDTYAGTLRRYLTEGAAPNEIAVGLGISAGAVHVRIHRGLKLLRRALPIGGALGGVLNTSRARGMQAVRAELLAAAAGSRVAPAAVGAGGAAWLTGPAAVTALQVAAGVAILATAAVKLIGAAGPSDAVYHATHAARPAIQLEDENDGETPQASPRRAAAQAPVIAAADPLLAPDAPAPGGAQLFDGMTPDQWLARFEAVEGWRKIVPIAAEIAALPANQPLELMIAIYDRLPTVDHRRQVLKPFVFDGGHRSALDVIDLAARDRSADVAQWAWWYLEDYAYRDFSEDLESYPIWRASTVGRSLAATLRSSAESFHRRLSGAPTAAIARALRSINRPDGRVATAAGLDLATLLRDAGWLDLLTRCLTSDDPDQVGVALDWLETLDPDEGYLRAYLLPLLDQSIPEGQEESPFVEAALHALGQSGKAWAVDELLLRLRQNPGRWGREDELFEALGDLGDPRAVPDLVNHLVEHDDESTRYLSGYLALAPLTGVAYEEGQDAAFWFAWLEDNRASLQVAIDARARESR